MKWSEAMEAFRREEQKEVALMIIEERTLRMLLAVWPLVPRQAPGPQDEVGTPDWSAAWELAPFDAAQVRKLAPMVDVNVVRRAQALRLIYPDGSVHSLGRMAVQKMIHDKLS